MTKLNASMYATSMAIFFSTRSTTPLLLATIFLAFNAPAYGGVLSVDAAIANGHFSRGVKLSDNGPTASASVEWNSDSGFFAGLDCYVAGNQRIRSFERACFLSAGVFEKISDSQAWSIEARRYDYKSLINVDWDSNEVSLNWHHQNGILTSLSVSDNWLARDTNALALDVSYRHHFNNTISGIFEAGIISPIESGRLENVETFSAGVEYQKGLWSTSIKASVVNADIDGALFALRDQSNLMWSIRYQLY